jgi:hypothetical protein
MFFDHHFLPNRLRFYTFFKRLDVFRTKGHSIGPDFFGAFVRRGKITEFDCYTFVHYIYNYFILISNIWFSVIMMISQL